MRISDWSSDVCSSDLRMTTLRRTALDQDGRFHPMCPRSSQKLAGCHCRAPTRAAQLPMPRAPRPLRQRNPCPVRQMVELIQSGRGPFGELSPCWGRAASRTGEKMTRPRLSRKEVRKSVGKGKSGSVRVELGGRGDIKKKNKNKNVYNNYTNH